MKSARTLGLTTAALIGLMGFAGTASATVITSSGAVYTGTVAATSEGHVIIDGPLGVTVQCESSFAGSVESHGAATTVTQTLSTVTFACTGDYVVHVRTRGNFGWHWWFGGNARLTSTSLEVEVTGSPVGNCIYRTNATEIGVLTGSSTTGGKATLDVNATLPRTGGSAFCGSTGALTGSYVINTPSNLNVD